MANTFKRYLQRNIGTSPVSVGNYTVPVSTTLTLIGLTASNITNQPVNVTATLRNSGVDTHIVKDAQIPVGSSIVIVGGNQKIVLQSGDSIMINSSVANSIDVIMSVLEIT